MEQSSSFVQHQPFQLRCEKKTRAKVWILNNTRIGPALDMKVCRHEDRYSIEVLVESLFQDHTASWVRIVSGPVVKARPRLKPTVTLSSVSILVRDRKWIDIETQRSDDQKCFQVSKAIEEIMPEGFTDYMYHVGNASEMNSIIRSGLIPGG